MAKFTCPVCSKPSTKEGGCFKHIPRKPLKTSKLKKKPKSEEEKTQIRQEIDKQWEFFLRIWNERPHYCQVTGKYLGREPKSWMFDHLLEKSRYKELKYEEDNVILCTFEVHEKKTNGFPLPKHQEFIDKAKKIFNVPD